MRKVLCMYGVLGATPFLLWQLPVSWRLHGHLLGVPIVWGILSCALFPKQRWQLMGRRKFWPFIWVAGLLALSLGFLVVGYASNLVVFSYGLTRPQAVKPLLFPMFVALVLVLTVGVERPLWQLFLRNSFLARGTPWPVATGLCAILGTLRSLPFYWTDWLDWRYFSFALLNLFILECTLCRLYLVTENILACGVYHAAVTLVYAFVLSDVLSPYLPAFHWISSSTGFYAMMSFFLLLPCLVLCFVRRPM